VVVELDEVLVEVLVDDDELNVVVVELEVVDELVVVELEVELEVELDVVVKLKFVASICANRNSDMLLKFYDANLRTRVCGSRLQYCSTINCYTISNVEHLD